MTDTGTPTRAGGSEEPRDLPPLSPPTADNGLIGVFQRRYLLKLLVRREVSARYQGSFLGLMWSYINPLSQFCIYYFILGAILVRDIPNFAIHIFSALVIVHFFTETLSAGTRSIVRNKALVRKMAMPREMFPVASMLVSLYHVGPQIVILLVVCAFTGWAPDPTGLLAMVIALAMIMVLGLALALLFSCANVFFRDVGSVVNILTNLIRFGVPMIYSYAMVDDRFGSLAEYYLLNPIANAVLLFQRAFWIGTAPDPEALAATDLPDHLIERGLAMLGVSLILLAIGQLVFSRLEDKVPERL